MASRSRTESTASPPPRGDDAHGDDARGDDAHGRAREASRAVCEATALSRSYAGASRPAVDGVTLNVRPGEVFGVLGRNGAGKTTLVRMLVGLLRPDTGRVLLDGTDVTARSAHAAVHLAYLPQRESALADMSVRTALETTGRLRGLPRAAARAQADDLVAELALAAIADDRVGRLSGGQRRLVGVATALAGERPLLVLDEPTTGLDLDARRTVWDALDRRRSGGAAVLLVTHNVLEAETVLDRVLVLHAGRPAALGTPGRLKERFGGLVRLDLAWRDEPAIDPAGLGGTVLRRGRRWTVRLPVAEAQDVLAGILNGPAYAALDDFGLAPPSLEDVLLACDSEEG
ncbi:MULTISPECIES: ABC transporter ATP-binding protein [Actinomadura]|uniref:ABC transporter ATP-binding protein n=1 Tax=Actinomadura yumaensis TaxID=111807 RepID=A0ABW2CI06_9ACTN|nr:ABC transporter ATP-binding protein [Actinomadura sp. J1-007]